MWSRNYFWQKLLKMLRANISRPHHYDSDHRFRKRQSIKIIRVSPKKKHREDTIENLELDPSQKKQNRKSKIKLNANIKIIIERK